MSDLEKALERWDASEIAEYVEGTLPIIVDAARKWASLTSPETKEKVTQVIIRTRRLSADRVAEAVLRSVEEGTG